MPVIPTFETQGTPQIGSRVAEIDPGVAGAPGAALAQAGAQVQGVAQQFQQRYVEARRQATAADLVAGASKQLGDLQFKYSKIPDREAAYNGFTADAAALRQTTLDGISDPLIKAHVQDRLGQEAVIRGLDTQNAAFQLESSARRGDLDTRLNQYAQSAATATNDLLRAKITDDAHADIAGSVAAGWLHPEEGAQHKLQFTSRVQQIAAEQERNAVLTSRDPDAARAFEKKINDPASFPGLLPQVREQLGYRAENLAYRIEAEDERRKREAEAIAIGRAKDLYTNEASAIDARGVGVMPPGVVRHQLVAAYGPEQGKALSDDLDQRAMAYNDFQKVALTSPAEDQAVLGKYAQPSGAFNPQKSQEGQQILRAIAAKEQGLAKDPAGYVQSSSPQIAALFQAAKDPAKLSAAVAAQDAAFDRLGVSPENRTVLATPGRRRQDRRGAAGAGCRDDQRHECRLWRALAARLCRSCAGWAAARLSGAGGARRPDAIGDPCARPGRAGQDGQAARRPAAAQGEERHVGDRRHDRERAGGARPHRLAVTFGRQRRNAIVGPRRHEDAGLCQHRLCGQGAGRRRQRRGRRLHR